jgi:tetratricopeptide (TPR) repeat protein
MKALFILLIFISELSFGQFIFPDLSPKSTIHQQVGYTTIDIHYGRPAARERKIMGSLVPYKKLWRTGAGKCTTLSFDHDVMINDKTVKAGIYALTTIPNEKEWVVLLNSDTSKSYGDPSEYSTSTEVLRFNVNSEPTERFYESLTITLDIIHSDAVLFLAWEKTQIHFLIGTGSHQRAIAEINKVLNEKPNDIEVLTSAAWYYYMTNESSEQILQWLNKALSIKEDRWAYYQKVDVLVRMKNYKEARITTKAAIDFLKRTKSNEWEESVKNYEERMKAWPEK